MFTRRHLKLIWKDLCCFYILLGESLFSERKPCCIGWVLYLSLLSSYQYLFFAKNRKMVLPVPRPPQYMCIQLLVSHAGLQKPVGRCHHKYILSNSCIYPKCADCMCDPKKHWMATSRGCWGIEGSHEFTKRMSCDTGFQ